MNRAAGIMSIAAAIVLALAAYLVTSAQLTATLVSAKVESAEDRSEIFGSLAEAIERGDLGANQYRPLSEGGAGDYAFVTYTVTLSGRCPLAAEWAVLNLSPLGGDVAFLPGDAQDVPPFGARTLNATLLTTAQDASAPRHLWVEYYVFGRVMNAVVETE